MSTFMIELKKGKRTGLLTLFLAIGIFSAAFCFADFTLQKDTLFGLGMPPMDMLLTQIYGIVYLLNIFCIVVATCTIYHIEFKGNAIKKIYMLPLSVPKVYLCKFLTLTLMFILTTLIQYGALTQIGVTQLPDGTFDLATLIHFAGYSFLSSMPVLTFMLLVSSHSENIWIPLGIGVAGLLSGMTLIQSKCTLFLLDPFVVMLRPMMGMRAQPDFSVIAWSVVETILFFGGGLILTKVMRYE